MLGVNDFAAFDSGQAAATPAGHDFGFGWVKAEDSQLL